MKTLLTAALLVVPLTTLAEASKPFCKTVIAQTQAMLTQQTDDDLEGIVRVPKGIPKSEWRLYMALVDRARYHMELYQDRSAALDILEEQCDSIYVRKMMPYTCGNGR